MTLGFGLGFPRRPHALRPALSLNFLGVSYLDPQVTFSRASNATQFDSLGRLVWAPANFIYYTNANNPAIGLSNTNVGGVWSASDTSAQGVQREVVGKGVIGGEDYVDIRIYGTNISGGNIFPDLTFHIPATAPVAAVGELWTFAGKFQIVGGSGSGFLFFGGAARPRVQLRYMTSAGVYISGGPSTTLTEVEQFVVSSGTTPPTTGRISGFIDLAIGPGGTVDCTIRVKAIRLERTGVDSPKAWIRNTTGTEYYGPRFDYNPATLAPRGLLFEAQRVNLQPTYQGVAADWSGTFGTISSTGAIILGNPALTFTVNSTAGAQFAFITAAPAALAASTVHTLSVRVKRGNHPRVQFTCTVNAFQPTVADAYLNYNFDTDTLVVAGSALPAPTGTRFVCADGSVILTLTFTSGTAPTAGAAGIIALVDSDAAVRFAGTATNGATVHVFGMQIEAGAFATSLIPTFGTAATRAGDVADLVSAPPYSSAGMTYYTEFERQGIALPSTPDAGAALFYWGDAVDWVSATFGFGIPAQQRMDNGSGGASQLQVSQSNGVPFTIYKCASRLALNDGQMAQNGALGAPDLIGTLAATLGTARYSIGRSNAATSNQFHGWLRKINVTTQPLPDATLVSLTA